MSVGRPPKPKHLHVVQGTYRADRHGGSNEPEPEVRVPNMPTWLTAKAKPHWNDIAPMLLETGVLTVADGPALALLADAMADYIVASKALMQPVPEPRVGVEFDADGNPTKYWERPKRGPYLTYVGMVRDGMRLLTRPEVAIRDEAWKRIHRMLGEFGMTPSARRRVSAAVGREDVDPMEAMLDGHSRTA